MKPSFTNYFRKQYQVHLKLNFYDSDSHYVFSLVNVRSTGLRWKRGHKWLSLFPEVLWLILEFPRAEGWQLFEEKTTQFISAYSTVAFVLGIFPIPWTNWRTTKACAALAPNPAMAHAAREAVVYKIREATPAKRETPVKSQVQKPKHREKWSVPRAGTIVRERPKVCQTNCWHTEKKSAEEAELGAIAWDGLANAATWRAVPATIVRRNNTRILGGSCWLLSADNSLIIEDDTYESRGYPRVWDL
jgi:hypothetical protein